MISLLHMHLTGQVWHVSGSRTKSSKYFPLLSSTYRYSRSPTGTHKSRTQHIASCWVLILPGSLKITCKLRACRYPSGIILQLERISLTGQTMTMNGGNWVATTFHLHPGYKSSRKSTTMGRSTEQGTCPRILTWLQRKQLWEIYSFLIVQNIRANLKGGDCANQTSSLLANIGKGMCPLFLLQHDLDFGRYGLAWNPVKTGLILGASEDMTICCWWEEVFSSKHHIDIVSQGHQLIHQNQINNWTHNHIQRSHFCCRSTLSHFIFSVLGSWGLGRRLACHPRKYICKRWRWQDVDDVSLPFKNVFSGLLTDTKLVGIHGPH